MVLIILLIVTLPLHAGGEKPFHLEFGRGAQKERSRFRGFDVLLGGRSKNPDRSFRTMQ